MKIICHFHLKKEIKMKIRRARVDGGESLCAATPENIGRKRCCHIADVASKATLAVITSIALAACNNTSATVPPTTESSMEASIPDGTFTVDTVPAETSMETTSPTNETTETTVYVWNGHYYMEGDPEIGGKSVTAMTLSEAQSAGYTSGQEMPEDEKTAYDYNLAWEMVAQGKSDEEIIEALCTQGYSNAGAAQFMVSWVREDYANGIRAYEAPQNTSGNTGSSSGSSSSGSSGSGSSGSSSSGGSSSGGSSSGGSSSGGSSSSGGNSGSGNSGSGNSSSSGGNGGNSSGGNQPTETQAPAPTETQAPAPTQPAATEPAQTQPAATEPAPTSPPETQAPTPTPVPPTPTPKPAATISYYELTGSVTDADGNETSVSFTGGSKSDVKSQYSAYCANHNVSPNNYNIWAVYSDGTRKKV